MDVIEKIFSELESNSPETREESKKKLIDSFYKSKSHALNPQRQLHPRPPRSGWVKQREGLTGKKNKRFEKKQLSRQKNDSSRGREEKNRLSLAVSCIQFGFLFFLQAKTNGWCKE
jgi:hypothetical protein